METLNISLLLNSRTLSHPYSPVDNGQFIYMISRHTASNIEPVTLDRLAG